MDNRIQTGIKGLDTILGGGFLCHNSILLKGAPGTGKTSLGIQVLLEGIRNHKETAIICSFEQFPQQLYRDTKAYGWDLEKLVADEKLVILFLKPEDLITSPGHNHSTLLSRVQEVCEKTQARRLLLDSVSHFNRITSEPSECRSLLLYFLQEVKAMGLTPILTAEMQSASSAEFSFEEYLVDEVVLLHNKPAHTTASLPERSIEVTKSRGHAFLPGKHPFDFSDTGLEVYPHILPEPFAEDELSESDLTPLSSGVPGIDKLIGGGFPQGRASLITGMPGAYKTTLAASFLAQGARENENGLLITFQETPQHLVKMLAGRGVDLTPGIKAGRITIRHHVPKQCYLDKIFADLMDTIEKQAVKRVVIDSLDDFERCIDNPNAQKDYLGIFLAALCRAGATTLLTQKIQRVTGNNPLSNVRHVSMVDTIVYLGNVEIESEIHKVISVLKSRASRPQTDLREIECKATGLQVSHKFHGLSGILQGSARGQFKKTVENIFQPLYFIRDFARMASGDQVHDEKRKKVLADIVTQTAALDKALKEHLGFDPEEEKKK